MSQGRCPGLRIRLKDGSETSAAIDHSPFILGRGGSDFDLRDAAVSRKHCEIRCEEGSWLVRDLGSSNGTFLNGKRISEGKLKEGDCLKMGETEAVFEMEAAHAGRGAGRLYDAAIWSVVELSVGAADRKQWLQSFLEIISKKFAAEIGFVLEYEGNSGVARPIAALRGIKREEEKEAALSYTIVEQVIQEKKPIVTTNADVDPRFSEAQSVDKYEIRTVVCAPVRWRGGITGAIYLERKFSKDAYTEEDSKELQDVADLLGVALHAWRGHTAETKSDWERDRLERTFSAKKSQTVIDRGGIGNVRRRLAEACLLRVFIFRLKQIMDGSKGEAWRAISQFVGQVQDIIHEHGGAVLGEGLGIFENEGVKEGEWSVEAVRAGIDIQKAARAIQKRLMREQQIGIAVGAGISAGEVIAGYFGSGQRTEYYALGDPVKVANILSFQANDGEILIDHAVFSRVHLFIDTTRVAPLSIPGFDQQIQVYRIVSY